MAQPSNTQLACKEADIILAISSINQNQIQSTKRATLTFNVPQLTLRNQRARITTRRDYKPNSKKLTKLKEEVIVRHILELDSRGFAPTLGAIKDIVDKLLTARATRQVGKNWPTNFVNRTAKLKT